MLFGVGKAGNIRRFEKIPAHKLCPARVNCESLFQLENARNELNACMVIGHPFLEKLLEFKRFVDYQAGIFLTAT